MSEKFEQLPQKEKEEIVGMAQEEAINIDAKAKELAGEGEKPTARHYQDASDQIDSEKNQKEIILTPEQEKIKEHLVTRFTGLHVDVILEKDQMLKKMKVLDLSENEILVQPAMRDAVIENLKFGYVDRAILIKDAFRLSKRFIQSNEVQSAVKEGLILNLYEGCDLKNIVSRYKDVFSKLKEIFNLQEDSKNFIPSAIKEAIVRRLNDENGLNFAIAIKKDLNISKDIIRSPEIQFAAEKILIDCLAEGGTGGWSNDIYIATKIKNEFELPISDSEIIGITEMAKGLMSISDETLEESFKIKNQFFSPLFNKASQKIIADEFKTYISVGAPSAALGIKNKFSLSEEFVNRMVTDGLIEFLSTGDIRNGTYIEDACAIKESFSLPEETFKQIAKDCFFDILRNNDMEIDTKVNSAIKISDSFFIITLPQEIIDQIPEIKELLNKIQNISSEFYNQALKSNNIVISLIQFKNNPEQFIQEIQENSFLLDAVSENPRFGSKLLLKYPEFDESSKENIQTLFDVKKEILAQNLDIDPESLEFRQLMQEKLKEYKNNPEILEAIKESGVNIEEWLNYSETQYFNLESGNEHLAFSEAVSAPIERIKETIDGYAHTLKLTLKEYRPELSEFKIPLEDSRETEEKIAKMQEELEKAKAEGDEKKAQGIEKGIESLRKKSENIKTVTLWDKLLGDISAFQQLKNDVFSAQEKLTQAEKDMQEKLGDKMPSGKMIQELKEKIGKAKEELRGKFGVLERRIEDFKTNLPELIAPCLNQDRTDGLIQEIEQNLAQQFDHWNTDRSTLANFFSERGDKEKGKLENQPMSVFVWARNPDIDLYQGNYSPCCICVDSAHMGAESTIADYNTDLGVQIINIYDETKNEPVTAAWCWIGKDEEGSPALVVDNIESNTMYSANYSEQLTKELFDYLENYAKSIGVKKIVLGKANNDLPTSGKLAKMKDDESKYDKLGGYNRDDDYFLEAEDKSVKLLWEKSVSVETKERKEKKFELIEFKNFSIESLTEKDFAKIKQLERKIYAGTDLISGQAMIENIKQSNGLEYSIVISGKKDGESKEEIIGYIAAAEDETDEGDASIYLEDIAVIPEAQGQGVGWEMLKGFIEKLKIKAQKENKPVLLDMHLRENSQRFMERHCADLEQMSVTLLESALVPDYYDEGEDALYQVYEIKSE